MIRQPFGASVDAPVVDPFRQPKCEQCAGNRGIEYRTPPGTSIFAGASGKVSFYGMVGGTRYLVIRTPQGRRLTYGRIAGSHLRLGDSVLVNEMVAVSGATLYFGIRENNEQGNTYVDPAKYLAQGTGPMRRVFLISGSVSGSQTLPLKQNALC